ncbi:hemerythrin domain-containing protein [Aliidiomarina maris]|uniref:Hemerythrin n=1 Tax=Aliidiomarina maris TaxID=531312 RepID=A0A327X3W0_9GAMM|nr:hemerythrin domain-containing protein [Aliidiomarina maris]RAK01565.1 hemerythrin HHE cation binding domain-containing protein [Aliidiomarina maris]RUO28399.1 hemerythrin [Aliidiomarina maris]
MTIFEELRADHDKQRALIEHIEATQGDETQRRDQFSQLKLQLKHHATAEERHFYAPLIEHDATVEMSRHGIAEHHELDELLAELEDMDMASPGWLQRFKALKDKMLHHFEDEEQGFFQRAGKIFDAQQKSHLGKAYRDEMSQQGL